MSRTVTSGAMDICYCCTGVGMEFCLHLYDAVSEASSGGRLSDVPG